MAVLKERGPTAINLALSLKSLISKDGPDSGLQDRLKHLRIRLKFWWEIQVLKREPKRRMKTHGLVKIRSVI